MMNMQVALIAAAILEATKQFPSVGNVTNSAAEICKWLDWEDRP